MSDSVSAPDFASRVQRLEEQVRAARRNSRRACAAMVLFLIVILSVGQVSVQDANFEVHPNATGGNPNDSYMLRLIGDGDTGADRAMTLRTIPTTDSDYRLAIGDNSGTERVSIDDDGNVGIGDTTPNYVLDVNGDSRIGWNGNSTRIKILPSDFMSNEDNQKPIVYSDAASARGVRTSDDADELYAFVAIPTGYKATHVRIYGDSTDTVTVYESDVDDGNWGSALGNAATGTEINITDVNSSTTNFLVVQIATSSTADDLYGGYVTISRQ